MSSCGLTLDCCKRRNSMARARQLHHHLQLCRRAAGPARACRIGNSLRSGNQDSHVVSIDVRHIALYQADPLAAHGLRTLGLLIRPQDAQDQPLPLLTLVRPRHQEKCIWIGFQ